MEIILREDVEKLGSRGEVVKVIDLFSKHITKISFIPLGSEAGGDAGVAP